MPYESDEDTFLLAGEVRKHAKGSVLDMGTGTGILALEAARKARSVLATDIDSSGFPKKHPKTVKFITSDLFSSIPPQKFDTIIFNPPYLPQDKGIEDREIYGGRKGYETIERFLSNASAFLKPSGQILLLFSSLTNKEKVDDIIASFGFEKGQLAEKNIFFETLYVYSVTKSPLLRTLENKGITGISRLAKGHRGIVYTGLYFGKKVCAKAERDDTRAKTRMENEAKWLKVLNRNGIGPKLLFSGRGYFAYEFVKGDFIVDYLEKSEKRQISIVIRNLLIQCKMIDDLGISKEEMHHPYKHIIVGRKPVMIDFERVHKTKKPKNVTQFLQFLSGRMIMSILSKKGLNMSKEEIIGAARNYRKNPDLYKKILSIFKVG